MLLKAMRWAAIAYFMVVVTPAGAQETEPFRPETLDVILKNVDWEPSTQGALLIIDPKKVYETSHWEPRGDGGALEVHSLAPQSSNGRYRLALWEQYFGRSIVSVGTLSVFAPAMMRTLNYRDLPPPDPYAGMDESKKLMLFASRLTPAQWRLLGGQNGIGLNDVSGKQRDLFESLLPPSPARIITGTQGENLVEETTLTPEQRLDIRLRAVRKLQWGWDTQGGGVMLTGYNERIPGNKFTRITSRQNSAPINFGAAFGADIRQESPNRLKRGDLDFAAPALAKPVSLTDAKTIGELLTRVAAATGVELRGDIRYADLPVFLRGDSARAGDLLESDLLGRHRDVSARRPGVRPHGRQNRIGNAPFTYRAVGCSKPRPRRQTRPGRADGARKNQPNAVYLVGCQRPGKVDGKPKR